MTTDLFHSSPVGFSAFFHGVGNCVFYQSQISVVEKAIEAAALMLGGDRSRGYCLEMICANFLAGANLDNEDPETLPFSIKRFLKFLFEEQRQDFLEVLSEKAL